MNKAYWKRWLRAALLRALRTVAQTATATLGPATALGEADWRLAASSALLAGCLSLLTSLAGLPEVEE